MDEIVFYKPPLASGSKPLRLLGPVTASHLPPRPFASLHTKQTATPVSTVSQKMHTSDWCSRNDQQEDFTASRNLPNRSDDDDYFPDIRELLSGTRQKTRSTSADLKGDDHDGFIDIDELLSGTQRKGTPTSVYPDYGGMAANMVENGTRGGSPTNSTRSTAGSSQDLIILSDDESAGTESETDYSNLSVDLTAKRDSSFLHIADSDMADGGGFRSGTTYISDRSIADHQDGDNDSGVDVFADNEDDAYTCSKKRSGSSAVSSDDPVSDGNVSISEPQGSQLDPAQSQQLGPATGSRHKSYLTNDLVSRHRRRRDNAKNVTRKRRRMPALTRPTSTGSTVSVELASNNSKRYQSVARLVAPAKEREIRDTYQEMVDDGGTDDSNDEDYDDMSDAAASETRPPPRSRKRVKRAKDIEHNDMETPSTPSLNVSYQATAATSSVSMQESEDIPIDGYLTLKTIGSKVVYCLTFSQEPLPEPSGISRQSIPRSVSSSSGRRDSEQLSARTDYGQTR